MAAAAADAADDTSDYSDADDTIPWQHLKSSTSLPIGKCRFEWTIPNFDSVAGAMISNNGIYSIVFTVTCTANTNAQFRLLLDHPSKPLLLILESTDQKEVAVERNMGILNKDEMIDWFRQPEPPKDAPIVDGSKKTWAGYGFHVQKLRDHHEHWLPGGNLTIVYDLTVQFMDNLILTPVCYSNMESQQDHCIKKGIEQILVDPTYLSDITLKCGDKSIPCHRIILASRSDVFRAMFDGEDRFKEDKTREVTIEDMEPEILEKMIIVMYTDCLEDDDEACCLQLLKAAEKYNFKYLKSACEVKMVDSLDIEGVSSVLSWALACNAKHLEMEARGFMGVYLAEIVKTEGFADLMRHFPDALKQQKVKKKKRCESGESHCTKRAKI